MTLLCAVRTDCCRLPVTLVGMAWHTHQPFEPMSIGPGAVTTVSLGRPPRRLRDNHNELAALTSKTRTRPGMLSSLRVLLKASTASNPVCGGSLRADHRIDVAACL